MLSVPTFQEKLKTAIEGGCYTPDSNYLQKTFDFIPVFIYGTHKHAFYENAWMDEMPRIGVGKTTMHMFTMYSYLDAYPVVLPSYSPADSGKIHGEVFLVPPAVIQVLDHMHQNNTFFKRVLRAVHWRPIGDQSDDKTQQISTCFMYVGGADKWGEDIKKGVMKKKNKIVPASGMKESYYMWTAVDDFNAQKKVKNNANAL